MKLEDIDVMVAAKNEFHTIRAQLNSIRMAVPQNIQFGASYINDAALMQLVRRTTQEFYEKKLELVRAKLATLGFETPE